MPVCLYIFLLVFQFACENFFPTAFLFHFFLSNFAPFVPSSPLCRCHSTLLPPPDPPNSLPLLMFFPLFLRPPSVPLVYPFLPPLLLFPTSSTIPLLLFSLLAPRSSFPFAILSFFLSLPFYYVLLFFSLSLPPALSSFLPFCPRLSVTLYLCISVSLSVHAPYFPVSFCRMSFVPFLLLLPPVFSPCFPASSYLPSFVSLAPESTQSSVVRCPIIVACHMHRLYL